MKMLNIKSFILFLLLITTSTAAIAVNWGRVVSVVKSAVGVTAVVAGIGSGEAGVVKAGLTLVDSQINDFKTKAVMETFNYFEPRPDFLDPAFPSTTMTLAQRDVIFSLTIPQQTFLPGASFEFNEWISAHNDVVDKGNAISAILAGGGSFSAAELRAVMLDKATAIDHARQHFAAVPTAEISLAVRGIAQVEIDAFQSNLTSNGMPQIEIDAFLLAGATQQEIDNVLTPMLITDIQLTSSEVTVDQLYAAQADGIRHGVGVMIPTIPTFFLPILAMILAGFTIIGFKKRAVHA